MRSAKNSRNLTLCFPLPKKHSPFAFPQKLFQKLLCSLGIISLLSLLSFNIFQINHLLSQTYLLQSRQQKLADLKKENQSLEINSLQGNSLNQLENLVDALGFEKNGVVRYFNVLESSAVNFSR